MTFGYSAIHEDSRMKRSHKSPKRFTAFRRSLYTSRTPLPNWVWFAGATALVLFLLVVARSIQRQDALLSWREGLEEGASDPWPAWDPKWPLLPRPRNTTVADLRGPYAFAARNAERLRYIPCFCGCAREGHRSALDCFVGGFTPQGLPIWTDHAFTCPLCVSILREVALMTSRGMTLPAIRAAIDEHHESMFATATPTPLPK